MHVAFLWIICALALAALVWAYFGRIDIVAAAQGKFQPTGRVKVVEPLETGRVAAIRVANGSLVKAGDVLVELDRSAAEADVRGAAGGACLRPGGNAATPGRARRGEAHAFDSPPTIDWPDDVAAGLREREERVLAGRSRAARRDSRLVRRPARAEDRRAGQA